MPRKKRGSKVLTTAELRAASLNSLGSNLEFSEGINLTEYKQLINSLRDELKSYNEALSLVDRSSNAIDDFEKRLKDFSERMLLGVATVYGKDSSEYEMAGGVRKSDRKRPVRRITTA
ncbi:hypothetical protein H6G89_01355 [Oscillatoria sp. FACHB-1407]|uniref:hypothetical protein n=1 Tax=Oscillatoria sp. FACHB-1407 TaxID=2692847 RepID=UPI00168A3F12|nr:hypothetical protein [Oscillatoria sp. FACHB-1407]MBD2459677.1 hypothetical protein [Oscillatoria sp. FACHB-1407]